MRSLGPQTWELQAQGLSHRHLIIKFSSFLILTPRVMRVFGHQMTRARRGRSGPVQLIGPEPAPYKVPRALPQEENISQPPYLEKERKHGDLPSTGSQKRQFMIGFLGEEGRDHINPLR